MKMPPCKRDCPKRCVEPNCHDTCNEYIQWAAERDKEAANRRAFNERIAYNKDKTERLHKVNRWKREGQR